MPLTNTAIRKIRKTDKPFKVVAGCVNQDAREVQTKFSKTFTTFFFPVGDEILRIVTGCG